VEALEPGRAAPKGVVQTSWHGSGGELGAGVVNAGPLKEVSFTGSWRHGERLHAEGPPRRKLRIQLEMGGKEPQPSCLAMADFNSAVEKNVVKCGLLFPRPSVHGHPPGHRGRRIYGTVCGRRLWSGRKKLRSATAMEPGNRKSGNPAWDQGQMETPRWLRLLIGKIGRKETGPPPKCGATGSVTGRGLANGYFVEPNVFAG